MNKVFLQAEWRKLIMVNYAVNPSLLQPCVPYRTELDLWNNTCYISLVGFMFLHTKVMGFKVPFHVSFEEVNLRFYVRCHDNGQWKRGVVFIKEIVPKPVLARVANTLYHENYATMPMKHTWCLSGEQWTIEYRWKKNSWNSLQIIAGNELRPLQPGSQEEFIAEHYWGYAKVSESKTVEYAVRHPKWEVYTTKDYAVEVDFGDVYGKHLSFLNNTRPESVFLAEGSGVTVSYGRFIR